jgi:hypothetical protein
MSQVAHFGIYVTREGGGDGWVENPDGFVFWTTSPVVAAVQLQLVENRLAGPARVREFTDDTVAPPQREH